MNLHSGSGDHDRGAGMISTGAGVLVFLLFTLFAVQLLFSLYASSTITAVAQDAVHRASSAAHPDLEVIASEVRRHLGRVGEGATLTWSLEDSDQDGADDTIALRIVAAPPRFVPRSIGEGVGLGVIDRTARARLEGVQPPSAP